MGWQGMPSRYRSHRSALSVPSLLPCPYQRGLKGHFVAVCSQVIVLQPVKIPFIVLVAFDQATGRASAILLSKKAAGEKMKWVKEYLRGKSKKSNASRKAFATA
jgi:hypothetical protein